MFIAFVFNFVVPGYVIIELFLKSHKDIFNPPLYLLVSVLVSTNLIYVSSLVFGLTDTTIFLNYLFWFISLCFVFKTRNFFEKKHSVAIIAAVIVFIIFILSLNRAIFYKYQNYYVMSADNWQDTALHMSIIESIKEGNFLPQAPYFSGSTLKYHYFTDLHTALLTYPLHKFAPRIIIIDNSLFAFIFFLSIYSLTYLVTDKVKVSIYAAVLATFSGSLIYFRFLRDYFNGIGTLKELILSGSYVLDYGKLFQMAPMTNYFLQNRPMMVGLSSVAIAIYFLLLYLTKLRNKKYIIASVAIAILNINFQIICSLVIFGIVLVTLLFSNFKKSIFVLLPFLFTVPFLINYANLFIKNFSIGPWQNNENYYWFIKFMFANLGIPLFIFVIFLILLILRRININTSIKILIFIFITLVTIPLLTTFTIDRADMLKFFYISYIPLSVLSAIVLGRISDKRFGILFAMVFIIMSVSTGIIDLFGSRLNKNLGYTTQDLDSGLWIRGNTDKNSVFVTSPTIHSPVSDIGGRLRVLSYTNWPYTHGYKEGQDNVFTRSDDVNLLFSNADNIEIVNAIGNKYDISYLYLGPQELSDFPMAKNKLESNNLFKLVYDQQDIKIYKRIK